MKLERELEEITVELERQGWHKEAELLRRFPRSAFYFDDEFVKGVFVATVSIRDLKRAEKLAQRLVFLAPENPFAYLAFSLVKLRQGKVSEAAKAFDRARYFASSFPAYRSQKIHWLCLQGKLDEGRKILRETEREFSDRWEVQRAQAHFWLSGKPNPERLNRAIELLSKLVRRQPNDSIVHALLAHAFVKLGDRKRAIEHLRLMAKNLTTLNFVDADAFIANQVAKETLAIFFPWLRLSWLVECFFSRWLPPRYFVAVGVFWMTVAFLLAALNFVAPTPIYILTLSFAIAAFFYDRLVNPLIIWWLRSSSKGKSGS
ncbi:MAG: hypothetical protein NZ937_03145 [Armatimonadetes bacterium]|nr:hypothetical protein [Armatimonadota bacterium]